MHETRGLQCQSLRPVSKESKGNQDNSHPVSCGSKGFHLSMGRLALDHEEVAFSAAAAFSTSHQSTSGGNDDKPPSPVPTLPPILPGSIGKDP